MADIDIQKKKGGGGWIWWLVGLVILALLLWWLFGAGHKTDDTAGMPVDTQTVTAPAVTGAATGAAAGVASMPADSMAASAGGGAVTALSTLTDSAAGYGLIGQQVVLMNAPVFRAVSDKGFWLGSGDAAGKGVFGIRENQNASYTAPNGSVDAGSRVNVFATVRAMPHGAALRGTPWNLFTLDTARLNRQQIYLAADSIRLAKP